jgi:hypothetical protein
LALGSVGFLINGPAESRRAVGDSEPKGFPGEFLACASQLDCKIVTGICGELLAVNTKSFHDLELQYREISASMNCVNLPKKSHITAHCKNHFCELKDQVESGQARALVWTKRCPPPPANPKVKNAEVGNLIESLRSPLAIRRRHALEKLKGMGPSAVESTPTILDLLKQSLLPDMSDDGFVCSIGYTRERPEQYIDVLSNLGEGFASQAVPVLTPLLRDDREFQRQASILHFLSKLGPAAEQSIADVTRILQRALNENMGNHLGVDSLKVLRAIGPKAKIALPLIEKSVDFKNSEDVALRTLITVDDSGNFVNRVIKNLLTKKDVNSELLFKYIATHPGPFASDIDQLIDIYRTTSSYSLREFLPHVLAQFGQKAQSAVPDLIKHSRNNDPARARSMGKILRKIDPQGELIIPLIGKDLWNGFPFSGEEILRRVGSVDSINELIRVSVYYSTGIRLNPKDTSWPIDRLISAIQNQKSPNPTRAMSAVSFAKIHDPMILSSLKNAMNSQSEFIRLNAATAFLSLTHSDDPIALKLGLQSLKSNFNISPTFEEVMADYSSIPPLVLNELELRFKSGRDQLAGFEPLLILSAIKGSKVAEDMIMALLQKKESRPTMLRYFGQSLLPPTERILKTIANYASENDENYELITRAFLEINSVESIKILSTILKASGTSSQ